MDLLEGDTVYIKLFNNVKYGGGHPNFINELQRKAILVSTELDVEKTLESCQKVFKKTSYVSGTKMKNCGTYIGPPCKILPCRMVLVEKNVMYESEKLKQEKTFFSLKFLQKELDSLIIK